MRGRKIAGLGLRYNTGCYFDVVSKADICQFNLLAGYLQDGRSGILLRPRGPADISPKTNPSSLPVPVPV